MPAAGELAGFFAVAFGIVVGGSLAGALVALLAGDLPLTTMLELAERLKLWATVAALGGSFVAFETIESGLIEGRAGAVVKQLLFILTAFLGAHAGNVLVSGLAGKH